MAEKTEDIDKIYVVDPVLDAERRAQKERERQARLNNPTMEELPPVNPQTGKPVEVAKSTSPMYPTTKPPREDVPMGGAKDD